MCSSDLLHNFLVSSCGLSFSAYRSSFSMFCKAGLVVLNSFSFCLYVKLLISPSNLKNNLALYIILGCRFFHYIIVNIQCHSLLAYRVSAEKPTDKLMWFPLYVIFCFSLVAFNIFSLSLIFVSLITTCLGMFLLGLILYGTLCASWNWVTVSFPMLGKISAIISSIIFSGPFSLSSPSGTPIMQILVHLTLSPRSCKLSSYFSFFFLFCSSVFHHCVFLI